MQKVGDTGQISFQIEDGRVDQQAFDASPYFSLMSGSGLPRARRPSGREREGSACLDYPPGLLVSVEQIHDVCHRGS